jgi:hypothetical protein
MKGYLKYLFGNLKNGNYTTGILIITTIIVYTTILTIGLMSNKALIDLLAFLWLLIGGAICVSWNNYWYDKTKKSN